MLSVQKAGLDMLTPCSGDTLCSPSYLALALRSPIQFVQDVVNKPTDVLF
jgi:hypothetical protein